MTLNEQSLAELDRILTEKCEAANVSGMALVVAKEGKPVFEKYYGYRDVDNQLEITGDTIFGVASLTKSLAALTIMHLVDQGKLNVDDPVVKWLPEFKLPNKEYQDQVKIHHLMSHTSGLPGMSAVNSVRARSIADDPDGNYLSGKVSEEMLAKNVRNVEDMLNYIADLDFELLGAPGETINYSNECFAMLQLIAERASGTDFIPYVKENLFTPLEMTRSTFLYDEMKQFDNVTELYAYKKDGSKEVFHSPAWWDVGDIYTNGSLKASVMDIIRYLEVYRNGGAVNGQQVVSADSIGKMTTTHIVGPNDVEYGYGLQLRNYPEVKIVGHGGSIKGVSAHMATAKDYSVAVLVNLAEVNAEDMAMTALHHVLGIPNPKLDIVAEHPVSESQLQQYVGAYASDEGQKLNVELVDGTLQIGAGTAMEELRCYTEHGFCTNGGNKVKFIVEAGEVKGVFSGVRYIPKTKN